MKKIISLTETNVIKLVNKVISELSPSIKNRSALAANKYADETGSIADRRRSQKDSFLEMPNHLTIMADNIAKKMEQYFDGVTLRLRANHEMANIYKVDCSLKKNIDSKSNIEIILSYRIKLRIMKDVPVQGQKRKDDIREPISNDIQSFYIHQYYVTNDNGDIRDKEQPFFDTLSTKLTVGYDYQSFGITDEHNGITARDIIQLLIRLHKKLNAEAAI
jgi:hypothetical protein